MGTAVAEGLGERGMPGGFGPGGRGGAGAGVGLEALRSPQLLKRTFSSLGERSYRNLWIGMVFQMGAMMMQMMTNGYLTYELTGSASLLGLVTAASALPALTVGLFGGVLADRLDKRRILQMGQGVSLFVALFIAVSITTKTVGWQHLLVASFLQGGVMPLVMPARQALVPQLVGRDRMMNAIALNAMGMSLMTLAAPAAAGGIIAVIGVEGVYYLTAALLVGAIFFTGLLPAAPAMSGGRRGSGAIFADLGDGFRYVFANRVLLHLILLSLATILLGMPMMFLLPIFAKDVFHVGPQGLGGLMSAMGLGSLGGALVIASLGKVGGRGLALVASGIVAGAVLLGFSAMAHFAPAYWAALAFMAMMGIIQSGRMTLNSSLLMEYTDPQYQGRVVGLLTLTMSVMPFGALLATSATERLGAPMAVSVMALLLILITGLILVASPRLRRLA